MQVEIEHFDATRVAVLEHRGPPQDMPVSIARFTDWRQTTRLSPVQTSRTFGVAYDNPNTKQPEEYRFDICGSVDTPVPPNPHGVVNKVMPANRCAVMHNVASREEQDAGINYLFGEWLPSSGEALGNFPLFFEYLKLGPDIPESERLTTLYLPLK